MSPALDLGILVPALLAGLLVLATHVPLGQEVLRRGIIFIDLAVAQVAGLGVIAAHNLAHEPPAWAVQLAAAAAALSAALLLNAFERRWPAIQEALIGSLFVLAASAAVLLLAANPQGGEHLKELLVGQILWVGYAQLLPVALLSAVVLVLWFGLRERLPPWLFYVLFALAVTSSVQLVGVYLVFASLILPALATRALPGRWRLPAAYALGALAYAVGLALSALLDLPAGALVVLTLAVPVVAALAWQPARA